MPKLNRDNMQEFICEIIEHFEDFLDAKGITINNPEKQEVIKDGVADEESICNIYGTDYGWLASDIEASLKFWKLIPKDPDGVARRIIPEEDMICSKTMINLGDEYQDAVACRCGDFICFKNRKPYEPVTVICPKCKSAICYG